MNTPDFSFEKKLWANGLEFVAGADEVGKGSFAGPVVAATVIFNKNIANLIHEATSKGTSVHGALKIRIDDSKKLTAKERKVANTWIRKNALVFGIGKASVFQINKLGIKKATESAFRKAIYSANTKLISCNRQPITHLLVDAFFVPQVNGLAVGVTRKYEYNKDSKVKLSTNQTAIIRGDQQSFSIASASIIAKVYRDNLMEKLALKKDLAVYEWHRNKGYGTKKHREAIIKFGQSKYHRKKFVETFLSKI